MSAGRRIAVVTGSRAEYGLLRWLIADLDADPRADLQLVVTGAHLDAAHGHTVDEIRSAGFEPAAEVVLDLSDDSPLGVTRALADATRGIGEALADLGPDLMLVLGDRYEVLAAAQAALLARVAVAHLHGGERTEGAVDDAIRHAVTKMSHLHFVAAEPYRRRVVQLGEDPDRVFLVGALGLDSLERLPAFGRDELTARLGGWDPGPLPFLVTYHPATLGDVEPTTGIEELFAALESFPEQRVIVTGANADVGGMGVNARLRELAGAAPDRIHLVQSLGQEGYLGAMRLAGAVVGNSSSGIIEAPAAGVPTVNVGPRQDGRLRSASVVDCREERTAIADAVRRALAMPREPTSVHGRPGASERIRETLLTHPLDVLVHKRFVELPPS